MRNIFKIAVTLMLALTIIVIPMTVMAATNYETSKTKLTEGTNAYALSTMYDYTVYILNPSAAGDFTITTNDGVIGIVSYLDMWVQFDPTEEIVNLNTIEWTCTDKNQSIMIAVKSDKAEVNITVTRKDLDTSNEVEWTIYENQNAPEKFVMPAFVDISAFDDGYVDFEDNVIDDAVLGDDGYYHLNKKDGPVLFANLDDGIMSLYTMAGYGKVAAIYYDDAGEVTKKVDYTNAFNQYITALSNENGAVSSYYYPLNADLIEMFKEIGATHGWYSGDEAWVYASEDAWLFACYFDENVTSMNASDNEDKENNTSDNDNNDNSTNIEDNNNTNSNNQNNNTNGSTNNVAGGANINNANTDTTNKSPATHDSITAVIAVAMLSTAAVVFVTKKK